MRVRGDNAAARTRPRLLIPPAASRRRRRRRGVESVRRATRFLLPDVIADPSDDGRRRPGTTTSPRTSTPGPRVTVSFCKRTQCDSNTGRIRWRRRRQRKGDRRVGVSAVRMRDIIYGTSEPSCTGVLNARTSHVSITFNINRAFPSQSAPRSITPILSPAYFQRPSSPSTHSARHG